MNMKKLIAGIFAGLALTACAMPAHGSFPTVPEGYYPATFIITGIAPEPGSDTIDIITAEDATGHVWKWYSDAGDWAEGDLVAAIMYDMETPDYIYDDIMLDERYVGIPEWYSDPDSRPTGEIPQEIDLEDPDELDCIPSEDPAPEDECATESEFAVESEDEYVAETEDECAVESKDVYAVVIPEVIGSVLTEYC